MKVHYGIESIQNLQNAIVTSGTFDGVHFGHKKIIDRLNEIARVHHGESVLITFWPHPRYVLFPESKHQLKLLSSLNEKINLLEAQGLDHLVILEFTKDFSQLTSKEFIEQILIQAIGTSKLVIGYDHRFGKNREGSFEYLKEHGHLFGFDVEEISKQELEDVAVSSTKIRESLLNGDVEKANKYLGYSYGIEGTVIDGNKIGRSIGFPTANIEVDSDAKLIPQSGVYAVKVKVEGEWYGGMLNIGKRPTVTDDIKEVIEVHIFDFKDTIYTKPIRVEFVKKLRSEMKFDGKTSLVRQLELDEANARKHLNQIKTMQ
ncbi:bifunctional riboflavin kinase/FAD synthetase [Sediminitomix flava]|uniref:Riboflavin biosynthesis protein n=1 Tax=Sediminitomix flava TaxID=379075 RepID=A0A315Z9V0_SEDFL|nr:bifunctional riboflavin kinase/FAD synthetase [Sediminitomix flava]PWJ42355.1 riboflavin kinase/FMN adenylyltransferase [Sediminitomix flava]